MSKKYIFTDGNRADRIIDLIRELGGLVCVDPCPSHKPKSERILDRILKK